MAKQASRQNWQRQDPNYKTEKKKYGKPAPSRAYIIDYLEASGKTLSWRALCGSWNLDDEQAVALERRLKAMERDGELVRNRKQGYGVTSKMDLIKGRVIGHPDGFGFLQPDSGSGGDLYISPRHMRQLMHGDLALMRIAGVDKRGRREGALVDVLERGTEQVIGRFLKKSATGIGFVAPDNKRINHDIAVPPEYQNGAEPGHIVLVDLLEQPTKHSLPIGRVSQILGQHRGPGMEAQIALFSHNIPFEWPADVIAEAEKFGEKVPQSATQNRLDLRDTPLVTIDGATARDFDDAVYCERRGNNWRLFVAIADVSFYVQPNKPLDREGQRRGTSVYFPDRVIPMLPEALSNGLCSLNPDVDRLCMVCELTINDSGKIIRSRFHEAVMRSHARLIYEDVAAMLLQKNRKLRKQHAELLPHLENLYALYQVLRQAREQRGAIDFETQETIIEYGPDKKIERIVPSQRNDAHKLIEECMIIANVAAARFLRRHKIPGLYRIHAGPTPEKMERLRSFLAELGLRLGGGDKPKAADFGVLLEQARQRPDAHLIQTSLLRSLAQAVYSPDNQGHFGLGLEAYAHFTSPIRRYPDLLVHRAIRHILQGGKAKDFHYSGENMVSLGEHSSMTERRADEATRDAVEWLKCEFMLDKVGDVFSGTVSSVTAFGLFIELDEVYVEGLLHVTGLTNDYYHFDPIGQRLQGERSGTVYRLADRLRVKVARVDLDERKIDFELVQTQKKPARKTKRKKK